MFLLSHLISQQAFIVDNFLDGQQTITPKLIRCLNFLSKTIPEVARNAHPLANILLKNLYERFYSALEDERAFWGSPVEDLISHDHHKFLMNDDTYTTMAVNKVALWEIVPHICTDGAICDAEDAVSVLREMAVTNQLFDDMTDWRVDIEKCQFTHWTGRLMKVTGAEHPEELLKAYDSAAASREVVIQLKQMDEHAHAIENKTAALGLVQLWEWFKTTRIDKIRTLLRQLDGNPS